MLINLRIIKYLAVAIFSISLYGCETQEQGAPVVETKTQSAKTAALFKEPIQPLVVETALEALPGWRDVPGRPTLVLLSNDPLLKTFPAALQDDVEDLVKNGSKSDFIARGARSISSPVAFEDMTLELALQSELFTKVVWVLPLTRELTLESFKNQAVGTRTMSQKEAESFKAGESGCFAGRIRSMPMEICSIDTLPQIQGPTVVHWEMTFFREVYKDEIRTPMYNLLGDIAQKLRKTNWRVAAVTINRSSLNRATTLATRFIADDIARLVREPGILDAPQMPPVWDVRQKAFYTDLLFKRDEATNMARELVEAFPDDASAHYLFYHFLVKDGFNVAKAHLYNAVRLDPVYALEYLDLVDWAIKQRKGDIALDLLDKARQAFPDDPFIKLQMVDYLIMAGDGSKAISLIEELQSLIWSAIYYPHIQARLEAMRTEAIRNQSPVNGSKG